MKPSSPGTKAAEARAIYDKAIQVFFNFDPFEELDQIIHPDFLGYGTAAHEYFVNREGVKGMAKMQAEQLEGTKFTLTRKLFKDKFLANGEIYLILEDFELYMEENDHLLPLRLSAILEKVSDQWVLTHFHGSTPDSDIAEEEAFPMVGLRKKNEELEAKIRERTRELEIEASLERVRTQTMAMQSSEDLSKVASVLCDEMRSLGGDLFAFGIVLCDPQKDTVEQWHSLQKGGMLSPFQVPVDLDRIHRFRYDQWKAGTMLFSVEIPSDYINKHFELMFELPSVDRAMKEMEEKGIEVEIPSWEIDYGASFKHGYLLVSSLKPFSESQIFPRFAKVFEQAYTRFLDLQKAEAQAREAQIEAALERVRANTMAMHKTSELQEVINTVYRQFLELDVDISGGAFIVINSDIETEMVCWGAGGTAEYIQRVHLPFMDMPIYTELVAGIKKGPGFFEESFTKKEKQQFFEELFRNPPYSESDGSRKKELLSRPGGYTRSCVVNKHTSIFIINHHGKPFSEGDNDILRRMANVFEQTYTRFLDLQKAEAQARESQIQLSLERIRAKTMAMQTTDELTDVLSLLFKQFDILGIDPAFAHLTLFNEADETFSFRITGTSGQRVIAEQVIDMASYPVWYESYEKWKKGDPGIVDCIDYPPEVVPSVFKIMEPIFSKLPPGSEIKAQDFPQGIYTTQGHCQFGYIGFNHSRRATEEEKEIVRKFALEFGRLYQRFLELKKAENQAREAQIEAALERVRSQSMGMQSSSDLKEVIRVIFEQLKGLKINAEHAGIVVDYIQGADWHFWVAEEQEIPSRIRVPYLDLPWDRQFREAKEIGKDFFTTQLNFEEKNNFYEVLLPHIPDLTEEALDFYYNCSGLAISTVLENDIALYIENFSGTPYTEVENSILKRFGKVFQQTYTRFLDLKKAETQAREAQIEYALEKVRSRTMAMHNTEDIGAAVTTFFNELMGLHPDHSLRCGIGILSQSEHMQLWTASVKKNSETVLHSGTLDMSIHPLLSGVKKAWDDGDKSFSYILKDQDKKMYFGVLNKAPDYPVKFDLDALPETVYHNSFAFKDGMLFAFTEATLKGDIRSVLKRFASVFGQTYTRYLDLLRAEAQAREAQIEAALERVRSQSLAMHNTSEMQMVANAVYEQLQALGMEMDVVGMSGVIESKQDYDVWIGGAPLGSALQIPYNEDTQVQRDYNEMLKDRPELFVRTYSGQVKKEYIDRLLTHGKFPKALKKKMETSDAFTTLIAPKKNSGIQVVRYSDQPYTDQDSVILKRFAGVFEQAYIRFMDLEKAEAQAREAQIEAALERVRARSMAMQSSDELNNMLSVLFQQFDFLGIAPKTAWLTLWNPEDNTFTYRSTGTSGKRIQGQQILDIDGMDIWRALYEKWKTDTSEAVEVLFYPQEDLKQLFHLLEGTYLSMPEEERLTAEHFPNGGYSVQGHCKFGYLGYTHTQKPTDEEREILTRFAKEFGRVYQRFLDIKKAEAQAREAQIEAALERVRARSMAMHQSSELGDVASVLFSQLNTLVDNLWTCGFVLCEKDREEDEWWLGMDEGFARGFFLPNVGDFAHATLYKGWLKGENFREVVLEGKQLQEHYDWLMEIPVSRRIFEEMDEAGISRPEWQKLHAAYFSKGYLCIITQVPCEAKAIFTRFAQVFDLAYTRFLDLEKAEAQAREAQIEAALERIRAVSMAMHKTEDVSKVVRVFFEQLKLLELNFVQAWINIFHLEESYFDIWFSPIEGVYDEVSHFQMPSALFEDTSIKSWKEGHKFSYLSFSSEVEIDALVEACDEATQSNYFSHFQQKLKIKNLEFVDANFKYGTVSKSDYSKATAEEEEILYRFAKVFEQTYTRFLDLKKAEAQAREAQIEAALEKVRSRTMAMQHSDELPEAANVLFKEVHNLGIPAWSCGYNILASDKRSATCWMSSEGTLQKPFNLRLWGEASFEEMGDFVRSNESFLLQELGGKAIDDHYNHMKSFPDLLPTFDAIDKEGLTLPTFQINHLCKFKHGFLLFITYEPVPDAHDLFKRFSTVFEQTYTRFLDLQQAEAQAKEAVKQASIDRIRGQIASMRSAEDLNRITPLIWNELTVIGVPFIRCGVFIVDESDKTVQAFLSAPDGKSLGAMRIPFDADKDTAATVAHWKREEVYRTHWDKKQFLEFMQTMKDLGQVKNEKEYQGDENPPDSLFLHFLPFKQGMLYVGNTESLDHEQMEAVSSLADAFSIAYARYEDFVRLEMAKERIERTLIDLKETQKQLIHSEKMASLGELTAGIAHEIQNPLNFVNNFSEVSKELIEEMLEEIQKGDMEEAKALAEDIVQNLEKIRHHGVRADGIVKGMLQHSRGGSREKELTDINVLADEYLRLAYHGLRAKDKSFNATLNTRFDKTIGKVMVIPQEIGRVILNLITNAFHVVKERKAREAEGYVPTVTVITKKKKDSVEIIVQDNGNGIPEDIREKIFQPFFTTKPTGQGTGLGLSMSYDIVTEGHGGELKVETKEGEGTEFIISLKKE